MSKMLVTAFQSFGLFYIYDFMGMSLPSLHRVCQLSDMYIAAEKEYIFNLRYKVSLLTDTLTD